jgi:hypothetical protein
MMRFRFLGSFGIGLAVAACGGSDTQPVGGGSADSGSPGDSSLGTDASGSTDGGAADSGGTGDDGTTSSDSGDGFSVASVTGLVLWLDAAKGVTATGSVVSAWADQSGQSNNAAEGRAGLQPAVAMAGINNLPVVHFSANPQGTSGNDLIIAASASLGWGTGDFLVEVVARYDNAPAAGAAEATAGYGMLYGNIFGQPIDSATGLGLYANAPPLGTAAATSGFLGFVTGGGATSTGTGYNDDMPHAFAMQRSGTTLTVRLDGAVAGTQTIASGTNVGANTGAHLGGIENAGDQRLDGDIAELVAVEGTIASGDLAGIEGYLKAKYDLP